MPVTAKLSKAFYDRLGEQLTNEIVDWFNSVDTELKDQNARQWEHFEAKLEASMKSLESRVEGKMSALETKLLVWMFTFWVTSTLSLGGLILMTR